MAAAIVANGRPLVLRHPVEARDQLLGAHLLELRALDGVVEVRDVGCVMLIMMDAHRLFVDMRLQRRIVIGQWRKLKGHWSSFLHRGVNGRAPPITPVLTTGPVPRPARPEPAETRGRYQKMATGGMVATSVG